MNHQICNVQDVLMALIVTDLVGYYMCKECPNMNPSNSNSLLLLVGPILLKKTETLEKHLFNARFPSEYHNFGRAQL